MKIYLGGPMFNLANVRFNLWLAAELRKSGFSVYAPNENASINDKTRSDITPERVYEADRVELESSNVFLCQVSEDSGTMWEAGYMDCLSRLDGNNSHWGVIGLATDIRLATIPDPSKTGVDNQSWAINAFIIGGLKCSLGVFASVEAMIGSLTSLQRDKSSP